MTVPEKCLGKYRHHSQGQGVKSQVCILSSMGSFQHVSHKTKAWSKGAQDYSTIWGLLFIAFMGNPIDQPLILMGDQTQAIRFGWLKRNSDPAAVE